MRVFLCLEKSMAGKSLGTLTLDLVARTGNFTGPMDKAARQTKKNSDQMAKAGKAVGIGIAAGATAAAAGLLLMIQRERDLIDQQAKTAQQLDTTYESMANLRRAGELGGVGFEKIETAGRTLNTNIGKAIQGVDAQAKAFDRLGVSAQEIYDLPLDERIAVINQALIENVQASERGAVAADIFGSRNAAAMQQLDPGTIAEAARQVEIFGLNLSDVDAAKVEMANDAMSTMGLLTDGVGKQLTVKLAPILKAIGDEFLRSAEEAGGLGQVVSDVVDSAVPAIGFVISAADGVARGFSIAADTIVGTFATAEFWVNTIGAEIMEIIDNIPGIDLSVDVESMRASARVAKGVAAEAMASIQQSLLEPLAGEKFERFIRNAVDAGNEAAEAVVKAREVAHSTGGVFNELADEGDEAAKAAAKAADAILSDISALEKAAITWGMTADEIKVYDLQVKGATESQVEYARSLIGLVSGLERAEEQQKDYLALVKELRTDEEKLTDTFNDRIAVLDAMSDSYRISSDEYQQMVSRIADAAFPDAPSFSGLAPEVGGAFGEIIKIDDAEKELEKWYQVQLDMLEQYRSERADLTEQWDEQELALKQEHEDRLGQIEQARQLASLSATESIFGDLSEMAKVYAGEQSSLYRAMFAVQKAAAIAQSMVAIQTGIAMAAANPFPANLAAMASVAAATASIVGNIGAIGMAHDGIDSIPQTGTWLLEKGERVTTAETSAKMDRVLEDIRSGQRDGRAAGPVSISLDLSGMSDSREVRRSEASVRRAVAQGVAQAQRYR